MATLKNEVNGNFFGYLGFAIGIGISYFLIFVFLPKRIIVSPLLLFGIVVLSNLAPSIIRYKSPESEKNIFSVNFLLRIAVSLIFSLCLFLVYYFSFDLY